MTTEAEAFLLPHDRSTPEEWEYPKEWTQERYTASLEGIKKLKRKLEQKFNTQVSLDDNHQDASYFASLVFALDDNCYDIRFSNFGDLATTINWNMEEGSQVTMEVERLLSEGHWVIVPYSLLNERYTGKAKEWWQPNFRNSPTGKNFTWFNRFFDYL